MYKTNPIDVRQWDHHCYDKNIKHSGNTTKRVIPQIPLADWLMVAMVLRHANSFDA